jgi:FkbM family methyltransferase
MRWFLRRLTRQSLVLNMLERILRHLRILRNSGRSAGTFVTLHWYWLRLKQKLRLGGQTVVRLTPRQLQRPLTVHLGATSDLMVFGQIFIAEEYAPLRDLPVDSLVIDLGANVGFSSAYFLNRFPASRIVAIEPFQRNIVVCRENLAPYSLRSLVLHGAAWSECTKLCLSNDVFGDGLEWSRQVRCPAELENGDIEAWDVGTLIDMAGEESVDLLKVDIEKGEVTVFGPKSREWLPRVRNICIELHGHDCEQAFFTALADFDYNPEQSGELTICRDLRVRNEPLTIAPNLKTSKLGE